MDETTNRLALPFIVPGQAQKEMSHNEALAALDIAVQCVVEAIAVDTPPADPAPGACWIVGDSPTGDWADHPAAIAGWTDGGWRFVAPRDGFVAWVREDGLIARRIAGNWELGVARVASLRLADEEMLSSPYVAIAAPSGGTVVDSQAREAIEAVLDALRHHNLVQSGE